MTKTKDDPEKPNGTRVFPSFDRRLRDYLEGVGTPTQLQEEAWSRISCGSDVLVISPTGSGKTLSALAVPFDSIIKGASDRTGVHVLYITPMKALGHDMLKNLEGVAASIGPIPAGGRKLGRGGKSGDRTAPIAVEIRTGDVPQSRRRRMLSKPPDVLITTPENLLLMLCSSYRRILGSVRFVVVDEVHEMMRSKRGSMLSLSLEYLRDIVTEGGIGSFQTVGLSATVSARDAERYMGGYDRDGSARAISVVSGKDDKELRISIRSLPEIGDPDKNVREAIVDDINDLIDSSEGSIVVFRNTRAGAEETAHALKELGRDDVAPHHGSLGTEVRARAESGLKSGSLKCIVSSTSLELGIDVGSVGLCVQVSSPGDPSRLIQRFGRAGHGLRRLSEGLIYPLDSVDLLDAYAVSSAALGSKETGKPGIDLPFDVLAQFMVGLSLKDGGTSVNEVLSIARRTSSFREIKAWEAASVVSLLSERLPGKDQPRPRLWSKDGKLLPRKNTKQAFYINSGTIPRESNYKVVEESSRRVIGELSRDFGASLYEGDVILLGSRSFRVTGFIGPRVRVREDRDASPTIPRWSGEVPSRPASVAAEVYRFWERGPLSKPLRRKGYRTMVLDERSFELLAGLKGRGSEGGWAPSRTVVPVEVMPRRRGGFIYVFHLPEGRSVSDPLARIVSLGIRKRFGAKADFVSTDEGFAVSSPAPLTDVDVRDFMDPDDLEGKLRDLISTSSHFDRSFANCAARSLLVLSRLGGRDTGALYKRRSLEALKSLSTLEGASGQHRSGPGSGLYLIREEAMRETLEDRLDLHRVLSVARSIHSGAKRISMVPTEGTLGVVGRKIIGEWSAEQGPSEARIMEEEAPLPSDILRKSELGIGAQSVEASSIHIGLLSGEGALPPGSDPEPLISEGAKKGLSPEDLASEGMLLAVRLPGEIRYYDPKGIPNGQPVPRAADVLHWRRGLLVRRKGMRSLTDRVPFFTHPLEIAIRAPNQKFDDIRSAILSGRLTPLWACGGPRAGDPRWAAAWEVLSPKGPAQKQGRRSGHDLPPEMDDMSVTDPVRGKAMGEMRETGDMSFEAERRLGHILDELGPMTSSELARSFGWKEGWVHPALRTLVSEGHVASGLGEADPTGDARNIAVWFWSMEWARARKEIGRADARSEDGWFPSTDPYLVMFGAARPKTSDPHVKGASALELVYLRSGIGSGRALLSQGGDLIRVHDMEVADYTEIGKAACLMAESLDAFARMGYDLYTFEGIMGVPAPEGAEPARRTLEEKGFAVPENADRPILSKGFSRIDRITRGEIVASILIHQGLLAGYHFSHPLDVLLRNLSIADRWEVLARLGSSRHASIPSGDLRTAQSRVKGRIGALTDSVMGGVMPEAASISDLVSEVREPLPEGKDLMRKLDLELGMIEQPDLVWSSRPVLKSFPQREGARGLSKGERALVSYARRGYDRVKEHPELSERSAEVKGLIRKGVLTADAWGRHHLLTDPRRAPDRKRAGTHPKGVYVRAFLLSSALSLGTFTFRDLMALSPGIGRAGRVRSMLNDLCQTHLDRWITDEPSLEAVYTVKGLDREMIRSEAGRIGSEGSITVISPKDRIGRVLHPEFASIPGKGRGYMVFRGVEPAAVIGFKRAPRLPGAETDQKLRGRLLVTSVRKGPAWPGESFLRAIRRRMFELGYETVTEADLERERSLYGH